MVHPVHPLSPAPAGSTAILSLPAGMGKTTIAPAMAQHIGATAIVDDWHPAHGITPGALHLTNIAVQGAAQ